MAKLHYPILDTRESNKAFALFVDAYNLEKPRNQRLRHTHVSLFERITALIATQQYERNALFSDTPFLRVVDTEEPYEFESNNVKLSYVERTGGPCTKTIKRWIDRLMEAGAIKRKIWRGSQKDYILYINPKVLCFRDNNGNNENTQQQQQKETKESGLEEGKRTNCCPREKLIPKKKSNNITIPVNEEINRSGGESFSDDKEKKEVKPKPCKNKVVERINKEHLIALDADKKGKKGGAPPAEKKSPLRDYQEGAGRYIFSLAMKHLFEGREDIYDGAIRNARFYVANNYFTQTTNYKETETLVKRFEKRIYKAKKWLKSRVGFFSMENIFPKSYFDLEKRGINPSTGKPYMSFVNLRQWDAYQMDYQKKKQTQKQVCTRKMTPQQIVEMYRNNPSLEGYTRAMNQIRTDCPRFRDQFLELLGAKKAA